MGLNEYYLSPCENTWTGRHVEGKCGHEVPPLLRWALLTTKTHGLPIEVYDEADRIRLELNDRGQWALVDETRYDVYRGESEEPIDPQVG